MSLSSKHVLGGVLLSVALVAACEVRSPRPTDDDDGGSDSAHASQSAGWGAEEVCQQLLGCLAEVLPQQVAAVLPLYGSSGTCWQSPEDRALCETSCRAQLANLHEQYWHEPACGACLGDADCGEGLVCRSGSCIESCAVSVQGCCDELCIAEREAGCADLHCGIDCADSLLPLSQACQDAYAELFRCEGASLSDAITCDENTLLARCGSCVAERAAADAACAPHGVRPCTPD